MRSVDKETASKRPILIDPDIRRASTLPGHFYHDPEIFHAARQTIFARSWQFIADNDQVKVPGQVMPCKFLPGYVDESILLSRDADDRLHCLSNVCTHRGNLLIEGDCHVQGLRCRYHGRRFGLDGGFLSTPGFEEALDFPRSSDNLPPIPFGSFGKFIFASIDPAFDLDDLIGPMKSRLSWLPLDEFIFDPTSSRDYLLQANWALYCDNYLEGFHIPYVHPLLAKAIDTTDYRTELYTHGNLQIGLAANPTEAFTLPPASPDYGQNVAAYYYSLFPNMMFNFYPWGLSINIVMPLSVERTKIRYLTYVWDESKRDRGAGADVDRVEREDEDIVEKVQIGTRSRFYDRGRYSPEWEAALHQFHRWLIAALDPHPEQL